MRFLLFIFTFLLHTALRLLAFLYKPFYFFGRYGFKGGVEKWGKHNVHQALAEDQSANVSLFPLTNKVFTKGDSTFYFGDEDDVLSYVLAMNYHKSGKSGRTKNVIKFLRWADKDHDTKSISSKILRDLEGYKRLKTAGIITGEILIEVDSEKEDDSWKLYVDKVSNTEREIKI